MVTLVAVAVPIAFLNMLNQIIALNLLSGADFLKTFKPDQLRALSLVFLNLQNDGVAVVEIFWGLWLLPFGLLVIKSGFVPRVFGFFLIAACFGYLADSFVHLLFPAHRYLVVPVTALTGTLGEFSIILWFLIKGVKNQKTVAV